MPINNVNVGTAPDNGTGESLRLGGQKINANFAYLKTYIDNLLQGFKWKQRVNVATTANITLSGEQTIDGVLTNASRILVKDQTNKTQNGIYTTGAGAWVRTLDADEGTELVNATVSVVSGTVNANTNWTCNVESITIGTTDIEWVNFSNISSGVSFEQLQIAVQDLEDELRDGYTGSMQDLFTLIQSSIFDDTQLRADFAAADAATLQAAKTYTDENSGTVTAQAITDALGHEVADDAEVVKSVNNVTPDVNGNVTVSTGTTYDDTALSNRVTSTENRITALEGAATPQEPISVIWNTGDPLTFSLPKAPSAVDINGSLLSKWLENGTTADEYSVSGTTVTLNGITPANGSNIQFHFGGEIGLPLNVVTRDLSTLSVKNIKLDTNSYFHPRGISEYSGDTTYSYLLGLGIFKDDFLEPTLIKVIKFNMWASFNFTGNVKIYKGASFSLTMSNNTLIEEFQILTGQFNEDPTAFQSIILSNDLVVNEGEVLYVLVERTTGTVTQNRWTVQSELPLRKKLLYFNGTNFSMASDGYYSTPLWLLSVNENESSSDTAGQIPNLTIPDNIYAVVGTELNLYYDGLVLGIDKGLASPINYEVEIICSVGTQRERSFTITPIVSNVGTYPLAINVYDVKRSLVETKTITLNIVSNTAPTSVKNIITIGDSLWATGDMVAKIHSKFTELSTNIPLFWGTKGTGLIKHEGNSGWRFQEFAGSSSPFWNNGALDIANYRANLGLTGLFDIVTIQLGLNDVGQIGGLKTQNTINTIVDYSKSIINAFLADNPNTKIIIALPTTDGNTKGGWGYAYAATGSKVNYQKNIYLLRKTLLETYDNSAYSVNVSIGIGGLVVDRYYGYALVNRNISEEYAVAEQVHNNAIHPIQSGRYQIGSAYYAQLQKLID